MSTQGLKPVDIYGGSFRKDGRFGAAISLEQECTNLLPLLPGIIQISRIAQVDGIQGSALFYSSDGANNDGYITVSADGTTYIDNVSVEPGKTYTISTYAKSVDINSQIRADIKAMMHSLVRYRL